MKTIKWIGIMVLGLVLLTGCEKASNKNKNAQSNKTIHEYCTRAGTISDGEVSLNYQLYYTGEKLNLVISQEKVISSNQTTLDTYEEAYKNIHANYKGLNYYDTEVIRDAESVTSRITIDYDRVDLQKLLAIEGEEDNIIEDGIAKVEKWKTLMKKVGTTCEVVEE